MLICPFCSLHTVKQLWCKLVMSFNVTEVPRPLCILHSDEARFHLCFLPSVNNIIRCGAHSCSTCECVCECVCSGRETQTHFLLCWLGLPAHWIWNETLNKRWSYWLCSDCLNSVRTVDLTLSHCAVQEFEGSAVIPIWRQTPELGFLTNTDNRQFSWLILIR